VKVVDFDALPIELAIVRVKGNGSRRLAVFADPDCPFCAQLEQSLQAVDDVTVYTFLYPIGELHPKAVDRATRIWCAPDRDAAWLGWVAGKREPPEAGECATPIAEIADAAPNFWVNGTPSLVFGSGRATSGAMDTDALEKLLDEGPLPRELAAGDAGQLR
jgi:thiol:disulfide interchange protein DsbC